MWTFLPRAMFFGSVSRKRWKWNSLWVAVQRTSENDTGEQMNLADARAALDEVIHSPVRLTLAAALNSVDSADDQTLREELGVSHSLLSKHAGYLTITKVFDGRTPTTRMSLTPVGREAFQRHLASPDRIMQGLA